MTTNNNYVKGKQGHWVLFLQRTAGAHNWKGCYLHKRRWRMLALSRHCCYSLRLLVLSMPWERKASHCIWQGLHGDAMLEGESVASMLFVEATKLQLKGLNLNQTGSSWLNHKITKTSLIWAWVESKTNPSQSPLSPTLKIV